MTTHTIDTTTNIAGVPPAPPEAPLRAGDEKIREALRALWASEFDPEILKLRHTPGNLVKIEHALIGLLGSLSETRIEIIRSWEELCLYVERATYREEANDAFQEISESEKKKFEASMYGSALDVIIQEYVISLKKRERVHWDSGKQSDFTARSALTLGTLILRELRSIARICIDHNKLKLSRQVNSKPTRD